MWTTINCGLSVWNSRTLSLGSKKGYAFKNWVGDWIPRWMQCTSLQKIAQVTLMTEILTKKSAWTEELVNMHSEVMNKGGASRRSTGHILQRVLNEVPCSLLHISLPSAVGSSALSTGRDPTLRHSTECYPGLSRTSLTFLQHLR